MNILAWRVEFENGEVELWPVEDYPDGPPFGETVTALVAAPGVQA